MILLSILLSLFSPQQISRENVTVDFKFKSIQLGKPTLANYYYDVSVANNTNKAIYVVLPNWLEKDIPLNDKVWAAQFDSFDKVNGSTLFCNNSITIFRLKSKEKITIKDYKIATFSEEISQKLTAGITFITCSEILVGEYVLEAFMKKDEVQDDNLEYNFKNATVKSISIKVK